VHLGDTQPGGDLLLRVIAVEPQDEDPLLTAWQFAPVLRHRLHVHRLAERGIFPAEQITELGHVIFTARGGVQRQGSESVAGPPGLTQFLRRDAQPLSELVVGWQPVQLMGQILDGIAHLEQQFLQRAGHLDLPALVTEMPLELAADAGHRVRRQPVPERRVVVADGLEQPEVADLHQVVGRLRAVPELSHARPHQRREPPHQHLTSGGPLGALARMPPAASQQVAVRKLLEHGAPRTQAVRLACVF